MSRLKVGIVSASALIFSGFLTIHQAAAGPFDGFAGAAVGFALGAMVAGQRPTYYGQRQRRVVVYRSRPAPRARYAATPTHRHTVSRGGGVAVSTASDPFAGTSGSKPIPVKGE